jgi:hypothetical protein
MFMTPYLLLIQNLAASRRAATSVDVPEITDAPSPVSDYIRKGTKVEKRHRIKALKIHNWQSN